MLAAGVIVTTALIATASSSTLTPDDQAFCAEQEDDPLAFLREQVEDLLADGGHWEGEGEAVAFQTVTVDRSQAFLNRHVQDPRLAKLAARVDESLFDAMVAADEGEFIDVKVVESLRVDLLALTYFCDQEG